MLDTVQLPLLLEQSSKARVSPAPPPPPPPPPPSLHSSSSKGLQQVTANNDSSSPGKKKWTLRVESRDTGRISSTNHRTEESIEIPKPQSVASLREQIASKLERKIASHIATFNGILPCKMQLINESPSSSLKESELTTESNVIEHANEEFNHQQHLVASTSMTHGRQAVFTSQMLLPEQQSVVHEPVQRHLSCITPLSFNRTTVLSSSTMHSPSMSNISTDGNDYQRTENIKNETRNRPIMQDRGQSLLPPSALSAPIGIIDFNANHSLDEHATMPSDSSHSGFFVNYQNKSRNERASSELEKIPVYSNHEHENQRNGTLPVANVGGEKSQFDAPSPSVTNARVLADAHKPLFSKPVELRTGIRSENGLLKTLQPETHAALHIPLKTISSHCSVPEQEMTVAAVASPQQDSHTENSSWYRTMFKKMHVVNLLDHPGLKHQSQDHLSPASTVQRATRAWTPNQQCDSQTDYLKKIELQSRRSKSVGRNVENQHRTIERPYLQCTKNDWHANTESEWRSELNNGSHSGLSSSSFYHYITNNFAQERSKTQHFHLPPYRLQSHDQKRSGVATRKKSARKKRSYSCSLICDNFSWDEMEYLYKAVGGKKGIHMELFTDQLNQLMKSITISGHLDESVIYLQSLLDCLQACASNCNRSSNNNAQRASRSCSVSPALLTTSNNRCSVFKHFDNLTSLPYSSTHSLPYTFSGKTTTNNQCYNHEFEFKKIAKEEVLTRQKVEKLSEELLQQQNRRHGYVPSASPALQKNFSRFSGLINEYGRPERNFASQILSPSEITTCTALFSFKALNSKELSFNRGDVIRVQRVIDVNWMEGERNGQIGIFPSSYVQIDDDKVNEQIKLIALYPFFARNRNELSLKKGETLRYLRAIDVNWIEGKNVHGQVGIFPKSYVRKAFEDVSPDSNETAIPDRPKTPHINTVPYKFVAIIFCMLLAF